jgi:hypothetical protein
LEPGAVVADGPVVWLVDRLQPVAVAVDPGTGVEVARVGWPQLPAPPVPGWHSGWLVRPAAPAGNRSTRHRSAGIGSAGGLWVQSSAGGPVARVAPDGRVAVHEVGPLRLRTVSAHGAWCFPDPPVPDLTRAPTAPAPSPPEAVPAVLLTAGTPRRLQVAADVHGARTVAGHLHLRVPTGRWTRRDIGAGVGKVRAVAEWWRLPTAAPVPDVLAADGQRTAAAPPGSDVTDTAHRPPLMWVTRGYGPVPRWAAGGRAWIVGWPRKRTGDPRRVVAVDTSIVGGRREVEVGVGTAVTASTVADRLWIAVEQPRNGWTYTRPEPVAVRRLDPASGHVDTVMPAGAFDLSDRCWPLPPVPFGIEGYARAWRDRIAAGAGQPNLLAELRGNWPDTEVVLTFDHPELTGVRLRRSVPLFDELGRRAPPEYADVHLSEDLATQPLPPPLPGQQVIDI